VCTGFTRLSKVVGGGGFDYSNKKKKEINLSRYRHAGVKGLRRCSSTLS
jgi:hypothetical protein